MSDGGRELATVQGQKEEEFPTCIVVTDEFNTSPCSKP
jgi:hypothetical protein